jgi:hypothetical protein
MSSKRQARRRTCEAKHRHATREAAEGEVAVAAARGWGVLRVYACAHCSGFHVGHGRVTRSSVGGRK